MRNVALTSSTLLSLLLILVHVSDDVVRGIDRIGPINMVGATIFVVWLYGTLELTHRLVGWVVMLLGSLFAAAIPLLHMFAGIDRTLAARPEGAHLYVFTLWALVVTALLSVALSARGLLRREWVAAPQGTARAASGSR